MHSGHATFQDQVKVLFFSRGQMKWLRKKKVLCYPPPPLGFHLPSPQWRLSGKKYLSGDCVHILMCLDWKKWGASGGSAASRGNFHPFEKLFWNIWCCPGAEMGSVRHVMSNSSRCQVRGASPLQGQVICWVIVTTRRWLLREEQNCTLSTLYIM